MKNKIVILTSQQNNVWTSMQEIVPLIESQWNLLSDTFEIESIDCDNANLKDISKVILSADLIILTVFNTAIAKVAKFSRETLGVDAPWLIYLHGQATLGMWPYSNWGLSSLFKSSDLFIGTCGGDEKSLRLIYPKANFYKSTFSYTPLEEGTPLSIRHKKHSFIYIGRISSQKQLHQLIWAFSIYKSTFDDDVDLHFFGSEDNLGSPNLGVQEKGYEHFLKDLCIKLRIEDKVHFHGFADRKDIHSSLSNWPHTLVYPSLHSDENFGMSLMRGLCEGSTGICSDWGGFTEHLGEFPNALKPLTVRKGKYGPFIPIAKMVLAFKAYKKLKPADEIPSRYRIITELAKLKEITLKMIDQGPKQDRLSPSPLLQELLDQKDVLADQKDQQIFKDYSDPIAHRFFKAYGMKDSLMTRDGISTIAPWVKRIDGIYVSNDPHKGLLKFDSLEELYLNGLATFL